MMLLKYAKRYVSFCEKLCFELRPNFETTMKESLKRTTNSKGYTEEKSNCPVP